MKKKILSFAIATLFLALSLSAEAQHPTKVRRIGYLSGAEPGPQQEAFRQGLRELGYVDGKNIVIEWRFAEGKLDRLAVLAADLVHLKVEVIVTGGLGATRPANEATNTIPIVMTNDPDPVSNGFVASLARPGGNITGLSTLAPEISGKQVELLKEIIPKLSRLAVLGTSTSASNAQLLRETELAAEALAIKLQYLDLRAPKDIETAFQAAKKGRADAVLALGSPVLNAHRTQIIELAIKSRLPAMYWRSDIVEAGGLISYGVSFTELSRRAATYVDKILKGAKPAELPVEQPKKFEFVVNFENRQANRPHDSAECAGAGG